MSNNGVAEEHGDNYTLDYLTDRLKEQAVDFIQKSSKDQDTPFFMYIATPAPHRPATPAPQYNKTFAGKQAPRTPSYGVTGVDKHWLISKGESGWVLLYSSIVTHTHTIHPTLYRKFKYLVFAIFSSFPDTSLFIHSVIHQFRTVSPLPPGTPPMTSEIQQAIDDLYEMRLGTLLSVDDLVTAVISALDVRG